jgi:hypothetical protein
MNPATDAIHLLGDISHGTELYGCCRQPKTDQATIIRPGTTRGINSKDCKDG